MPLGDILSKLGAGQELTPGEITELRLQGNRLQALAGRVDDVIDPATGGFKNALTWVQLGDQTLTAAGTFTFSSMSLEVDEFLRIPGGRDEIIEYEVPLRGVHGSLVITSSAS